MALSPNSQQSSDMVLPHESRNASHLCCPLHTKQHLGIYQSFKMHLACASQDTGQGKEWQPEPAASQGRATRREEPWEEQVFFNSWH